MAGSCFCPYPCVECVHPFMWQERRFQFGAFSTASVRGLWAHCKLQTCDLKEQSSESCRNAETALSQRLGSYSAFGKYHECVCMIKTRGSVQKVEVLLHRLFGSEKPYQGLAPRVLKQLEGREVNGTGGVGCSEAGCKFCSHLPLRDCSFGCSWRQQRYVCKCSFCSLVLPMRCQTLFWGLFCGVLILLNTLIKGRRLHQSLQVHCVPLLGTGVQESGAFWHRHGELGRAFGNYRNDSCCLLCSVSNP